MTATIRMLGGFVSLCVLAFCSDVDAAVPMMRSTAPNLDGPPTEADDGAGPLMRSRTKRSAVVHRDGSLELTNVSHIDRRSLLTKRVSAGECNLENEKKAAHIFKNIIGENQCGEKNLIKARKLNACSTPDKLSCPAIERLCSLNVQSADNCATQMSNHLCVEDTTSDEPEPKRGFCLTKQGLNSAETLAWWETVTDLTDQRAAALLESSEQAELSVAEEQDQHLVASSIGAVLDDRRSRGRDRRVADEELDESLNDKCEA